MKITFHLKQAVFWAFVYNAFNIGKILYTVFKLVHKQLETFKSPSVNVSDTASHPQACALITYSLTFINIH